MSNDGHYKIQFNLFTTPRDLNNNKKFGESIFIYIYTKMTAVWKGNG